MSFKLSNIPIKPKERTYTLTGGTLTADLDSADVFYMNMSAATTLSHSGGINGKQYVFVFIQDTTNKALTWATSKYRFSFNNAPSLTNPTTNGSSPAHSEDIITGIFRSGRLDIVITPDLQNN
jgi:hypothetical protein